MLYSTVRSISAAADDITIVNIFFFFVIIMPFPEILPIV